MGLSIKLSINKIQACLINQAKMINAIKYSFYMGYITLDGMAISPNEINQNITYYIQKTLEITDEIEISLIESKDQSKSFCITDIPHKKVNISSSNFYIKKNNEYIFFNKIDNSSAIEVGLIGIDDTSYSINLIYKDENTVFRCDSLLYANDRIMIGFTEKPLTCS